jgi:hypothetical protein
MNLIKSKQSARKDRAVNRRIRFAKILEISFWGTVIWGILRLFAHFLHFTPYGIDSFARPLLGMNGENSPAGIALGTLVLFVVTAVATVVYALFFSRANIWWGGLIYGLAFLLIVGFFFQMGRWKEGTLSTEIAWFLSFGLFIGMSLFAERSDYE